MKRGSVKKKKKKKKRSAKRKKKMAEAPQITDMTNTKKGDSDKMSLSLSSSIYIMKRKVNNLHIVNWLTISFFIRVMMVMFGEWQDRTMRVKYTDVDYYVFTDAAKFVVDGKSPYLRSTYRYPPVLAWILTLNITVSPLFGKMLFVLCDILVGSLIHKIVIKSGFPESQAKVCALSWLLNPLPIGVSTRGSAESLIAFMVLQSLDFLLDGKIVRAAICYAISVHLKIYPITYALSIYLYLGRNNKALKQLYAKIKQSDAEDIPSYKIFLAAILPSRETLLFISVATLTLSTATTVCYLMYGWEFLYETYFYHVVRGDIRHNFSPYFYLLYLMADPEAGLPLTLRLLLFLPQLALVIAVAWRFHRQPPVAWLLTTFLFVSTNKVCTSQYFLWYLSLLPVVLPHVKMGAKKAAGLVCMWFFAQGVWLLSAYLLEFKGYNTFLFIWASGLLFFMVNVYIATCIVNGYKE